jgi:hypothetical protein
MTPTRTAVAVLIAAGALAGCGSAREALGVAKVTPDEFRVVTKAPLVVPPDYALRPPTPGEPRPAELLPDSAARQAVAGQRASANRSAGEQVLVAKAGAERADPLARYVVDDEFGDLAYKDKSFADRVMFWRKDDPAQQGAVTADPSTIDPAVEAERVKNLTGGKDIVIAREKPRFKLPGL